MANWQTLLKQRDPLGKKADQEFLDSLPPEVRRDYEAWRKDRDGTKSEEEVKYMLQIEELLNEPKVESMENELESMKKNIDDKATELMRYVWDNDMNPVDEDDPEVDRYGPGFKASEALGKWVEEIQSKFGGNLPW